MATPAKVSLARPSGKLLPLGSIAGRHEGPLSGARFLWPWHHETALRRLAALSLELTLGSAARKVLMDGTGFSRRVRSPACPVTSLSCRRRAADAAPQRHLRTRLAFRLRPVRAIPEIDGPRSSHAARTLRLELRTAATARSGLGVHRYPTNGIGGHHPHAPIAGK